MVFLSLGVLSFGVALATRVWFSSGAMEFEGAGGQPRPRWLSQQSSIPVYGPQPLWVFKTDVLTKVGKIRLIVPTGEAVSLDVTKADQAYLPMFTKGTFLPRRHSILFESAYDAWYQQVAGQIVYPPILTSIPLLMTRGASEPEPFSRGLSFRCLQECTLAVLHNSGEITTAHLSLETLFSPPGGGQAVEVASFVTMSHDAQITMSAAPDWVPLDKRMYKSSGQFEPIALPILADSTAYKLRITTLHADADAQKAIMKVVITESPVVVLN